MEKEYHASMLKFGLDYSKELMTNELKYVKEVRDFKADFVADVILRSTGSMVIVKFSRGTDQYEIINFKS